MRTAAQRTEKYTKKIAGSITAEQIQRQQAAAARQEEIELAVKNIVGVDLQRFSYHAYAQELEKLKTKYAGPALVTEAGIMRAKWITRGLGLLKLKAIENMQGISVPYVKVLFERIYSTEASARQIRGAVWRAQTITTGTTGENRDHVLISIEAELYRGALSPGTITLGIRNVDGTGKPTGSDIVSASIDGSTIPPSAYTWIEFILPEMTISAGSQHAIVIRAPGAGVPNRLLWRDMPVAETYIGGKAYYSSNSGSTWAEDSAGDNTMEEYGQAL